MKRGLFVTFEGGEGAGKSTLAQRISNALKAEDHDVLFTREPGGTSFGEELRAMLLHHKGPVSSKAELFLFLASRIQHLEELILPALERGSIVLSDRFSDSSIAYQGSGRGLGIDYVTKCCTLATGGIEPDLTFYIDIDPQIGLARTNRRRARTSETIDRLESQTLEFHRKVREGFLTLAKAHPNRIIVLDGTLPADTLFSTAYEHILSALRR